MQLLQRELEDAERWQVDDDLLTAAQAVMGLALGRGRGNRGSGGGGGIGTWEGGEAPDVGGAGQGVAGSGGTPIGNA